MRGVRVVGGWGEGVCMFMGTYMLVRVCPGERKIHGWQGAGHNYQHTCNVEHIEL